MKGIFQACSLQTTRVTAKLTVCHEQWHEVAARGLSHAGTISKGNSVDLVVRHYCVQACAEIGSPWPLIGPRAAELIRQCRPPVPYLNSD